MDELEQLARDPSPESWRLLCEGLAALPEDAALTGIERIEGILDAWPDELRATMCTLGWDDTFLAGQPDPRSRIIRYFRFDSVFLGRYGGLMMRNPRLSSTNLRAFCAAPGVAA